MIILILNINEVWRLPRFRVYWSVLNGHVRAVLPSIVIRSNTWNSLLNCVNCHPARPQDIYNTIWDSWRDEVYLDNQWVRRKNAMHWIMPDPPATQQVRNRSSSGRPRPRRPVSPGPPRGPQRRQPSASSREPGQPGPSSHQTGQPAASSDQPRQPAASPQQPPEDTQPAASEAPAVPKAPGSSSHTAEDDQPAASREAPADDNPPAPIVPEPIVPAPRSPVYPAVPVGQTWNPHERPLPLG